jgi:hypothetical protein
MRDSSVQMKVVITTDSRDSAVDRPMSASQRSGAEGDGQAARRS